MTSISNALKVIVNLKCFENKDILESDTTIILASYVMISDKDCDETFIKGIFDFSGSFVSMLVKFTDREKDQLWLTLASNTFLPQILNVWWFLWDLTKFSPDAFQEDALQHHIFESSNFTKTNR